MEESIISTIRTKYNTLSPVQKVVADYTLSNSDKVFLHSISELAHQCNTSETTIIRFLRKIDCSSYQVFRVKIAQELSDDSGSAIFEDVTNDDDVDTIKRKVIHSTVNSINDLNHILDATSLKQFVDTVTASKKTYFIGVGASSSIASDAHHKFLRLGMNASCYDDSHMMSIACTHASQDDLVVAVSHSGESLEIIDAVLLAKKHGAKIAVLTSYSNSSLTKLADIILLSSSQETKYRSDAMTSRIIQLVIIDILYVSTVLKLGGKGILKVNESRVAVAKKKT